MSCFRLSRSVISVFFSLLILKGCATPFDKTNILPGQQVQAQKFTFNIPKENVLSDTPWFAVQYGNSHKIHLSQHNHNDSFKIFIAANKGPWKGMYTNAEAHRDAIKRTRRFNSEKGYLEKSYTIEADETYGPLCVKYASSGENWQGRASAGPALIETKGLSCAHQTIPNVIVKIEISRRYETDSAPLDMDLVAEELFQSINY